MPAMEPRHSTARAVLVGHAALLLGAVAVGRWLAYAPSLGPVLLQGTLGAALGGLQLWRGTGALRHPLAPLALWGGMWLGLLQLHPYTGQALGAVVGGLCAWVVLERLSPTLPSRPELVASLSGLAPLALPILSASWLYGFKRQPVLDQVPTATAMGLALVLPVVLVAWLRPQVSHWAGWAVALVLCLPITQAPPGERGPGVLLLTVDVLRADAAEQMSTYQRLAAEGEVFADVLSTSSWTVPSLASMHTGLWPSHHGAGRNALPWLQVDAITAEAPTLAERFRDAGYATCAVVCNGFVTPDGGFARGFATFDHDRQRVWAPLLLTAAAGRRADGSLPFPTGDDDARIRVDHALAWLEDVRGPWFLWVHVLDPHLPYLHAELPATDPLALQVGRRPFLSVSEIRRGNIRVNEGVQQSLRAAYAEEVAWVDAELTRLLDAVGPADTVLFTGDHGEEFWEHDGFEHGHAIWPEIVEVPLVLRRPGGPVGVRTEPASVVDVSPTLLASAGLEVPDDLDGIDLTGTVPADRARFVEGTLYFEKRRAVVQDRWAWLAIEGQPGQLFDRDQDPGWHDDAALLHADVAATLQDQLDGLEAVAGQAVELDREALEALGYLSAD